MKLNDILKEINKLNKTMQTLNIEGEMYHLELVERDGAYSKTHTLENKKDIEMVYNYYIDEISDYLENGFFTYNSIEKCYISNDIITEYKNIYFKVYLVRGF